MEENLSQGGDAGGRGGGGGWGCGSVSLAGGRLEEGGSGPETGAAKGDHIQAPGDRRLGVA